MEIVALYFLLGHVLGDFFFQTGTIVQWKYAGVNGIFIHVALVMLALCMVFFPFISLQVVLYILANGVLHTFVDIAKVRYDNTYRPKNPLPGFWVDQCAHVGIGLALIPVFFQNGIVLQSWVPKSIELLYNNVPFLLYMLGVMLGSYFFDIYLYLRRRKKGDESGYTRAYYHMLIRITLFAVAYYIVWLSALYWL